MYYGAGPEQTASAVIADPIDITRLISADPAHRVPYLAFQPGAMADTPILPMAEIVSGYYLRMQVCDQPGALADITRILADSAISIDALRRKEPPEGASHADVVILTHRTQEKNMDAALARIAALPTVAGKPTRLRIEMLA